MNKQKKHTTHTQSGIGRYKKRALVLEERVEKMSTYKWDKGWVSETG